LSGVPALRYTSIFAESFCPTLSKEVTHVPMHFTLGFGCGIPVVAGGAYGRRTPFLCLPVDGVTAENVEACTKLLNSKLEDKLFPHSSKLYGVKLIERANQWYLAFYMDHDVRLSDVQSALESTEFSIPQDRLHLFGHAILDIPRKDRWAWDRKSLAGGGLRADTAR
jgi:hypothetical protein